MRLMSVMSDYIHEIRRHELSLLWEYLGERRFRNGLELGAGDGWASGLLSTRIAHLTVTDIDPAILRHPPRENLTYRVLDAEHVGEVFASAGFDFVLSSNMLEHLPDSQRALRDIRTVMDPAGLSVHVVPSVMWKINQLLLFLPNQILRRIERYSTGDLPAWFAPRLRRTSNRPDEQLNRICNNPKSATVKRRYLSRMLLPPPHGVSRTHIEEFRAFRKKRWLEEFEAAGYEVVAYMPGPWTSAYGFGCGPLRGLLRVLAPPCEHMFVLRHTNVTG